MSDLTVQMLDLNSSLIALLLALFVSRPKNRRVPLLKQVHEVVGQVCTTDRDLSDEVR